MGDAMRTTLDLILRDSCVPLTVMIGGGPFRRALRIWTDATMMGMALAKSLAECGAFDPTDLMGRFMRLWRDGESSPTGICFDIGMMVELHDQWILLAMADRMSFGVKFALGAPHTDGKSLF